MSLEEGIAVSGDRQAKKHLLIIDGDPLVARGLSAVLRLFPEVEPMFIQGVDLRDGLRRVHGSGPDAVLISIVRITKDSISLVRAIRNGRPSTLIIVTAADDRPDWVSAVLHAGANSYLYKGLSPGSFERSLGRSLYGESVVAVPAPASWLEFALHLRRSKMSGDRG